MFRRRRDAVEVADRPATAWSPAQIVAFVIGAAAVVLGAVALTRTGFHLDRLFDNERTVLTFHHTELLAIVEIGFGVVMMLAALSPGGRSLMWLLSAAVLAFGVVILADLWQGRLHHWLGVHDRNGWLFVIVGSVGVLAAMFLPTVYSRGVDRTARRRTGLLHH